MRAEQLELANGEARGPEVELGFAPSGPRTVASSCSTPVAGSNGSPASRWRTANPAENALTARRPPGRDARRAIRPNTSVSSRPPRSPKPPWHRQMVASNSPGAVEVARRRAPRTVADSSTAAAASRARRDELRAVVDADDLDRRGGPSASGVPPGGPHPTSSTRIRRLERASAVDQEVDLLLGALW